MRKSIPVLLIVIIFSLLSCSSEKEKILLYCGQYTKAAEKGLTVFEFNQDSGSLNKLSESDAGTAPSYFVLSGNKKLLYAANHVTYFNGIPGGGLTTMKFDSETSQFKKIHELPVPNGDPCFISLSPDNNFLLFANYSGGSVAVVKLDEKGMPGKVTDSVFFAGAGGKLSHAHMISFGPQGKRVYLTDLGLDRIVIFDLDVASGRLHQTVDGIVNLPAGAGPRHFVFNSAGTKMYVINELNSTVAVFEVAENGKLDSLQTISTLREGYTGKNSCADIHLSKDENFLYGSNRGENTIVTFRVSSDGLLNLAGHTSCGGDWPRNFVIDPSDKYLLVGNQNSDNISVFQINEKTGLPIEPGESYKINSPVCLKFK